jgi:hypothetical protein
MEAPGHCSLSHLNTATPLMVSVALPHVRAMKQTNEVLKKAVLSKHNKSAKQRCSNEMIDGMIMESCRKAPGPVHCRT